MFVAEGEQSFQSSKHPVLVADFEPGQRQRLAREKLLDLREMILVDVQVAERVYELADLQLADVRDHVRQQGVGTDVEGHAEEGVRRALVKLTVECATALDFKLKERVAGREVYVVCDARVPACDDEAARVRVVPNLAYESGDLVNAVARGVVAAERAPEVAVDGAEVTLRASEALRMLLVGPLLPDVNALRAQRSLVRVA